MICVCAPGVVASVMTRPPKPIKPSRGFTIALVVIVAVIVAVYVAMLIWPPL